MLAGYIGDGGFAERVEDAPCNCGIGGLVWAQETDRQLGAIRCPDCNAVPVEIEDLEGLRDMKRYSDAGGTPTDDAESGLVRACYRGRVASLDDLRLLCRDCLDRRAENVHVIQSDIRDRRNAALPDVCRVEAAPDANLDHGYFDTDASEMKERGCRQDLELSRGSVSRNQLVVRRDHFVEKRCEIGNADRLPVDLDSLAIRDEMGLRCLPGPITR